MGCTTTVFVFVNLEPGSEEEVKSELKQIPQCVSISEDFYAQYSFMLKLVGKYDVISEIINGIIRKMPHVRSTLTLTASSSWVKE